MVRRSPNETFELSRLMVRPSRVGILCLVLLGCSSGTEPSGPTLSRIEIHLTPTVTTLLANDTARGHVSGFDQSGAPYPAGPVVWRSTNTAVAHVDDQGLVHAQGPGSTMVIVTVGRLSDTVAISVVGTLHRQAINTNETWTLAGSPHVVRGQVTVGGAGGAALTIEPGAVVVFEDGAGLTFGLTATGSLIAHGTAAAPITMRGTSTTPVPGAWIGLTFRGLTQSELRYVTLSGCGGARSDDQPMGCVVVGHRFLGSDPTLLVDNVTVQDAAAAGVILQGKSRFASGSAGLSVRNVRGHVATLPAGAAAGFPLGGSFTANDLNEIRLTGDTIRTSSTWQNPGLAWTVLERVLIEGPQSPVLTIPPGLSFAFVGGGFSVGKNAPGGLRIGATGGATVNLTLATGAYGWGGIVFFPSALPSSTTGTVLENCGSANDSGYGQGCIFVIGNFFGTAPAPVLQSVTIRRAVDVGVGLVGGGRFGDGSSNVVITETQGSLGVPISVYEGEVSSIPDGQYTGNALDVIWISRIEITHSQTWRDHGVAYMMRQGLSIEHSTNPVLTLDPGVEMRFSPGGLLAVGTTAPGAFRALGTDSAPILLTGEYAHPGAWMGVDIGPNAAATTLLDHVIVDYAGADDGAIAAGIRIHHDYGEIIRRTLTRRSGGCGITRLSGSSWSTDFTAAHLGNTFENNVGPAQCGP